MLQRKLLFLLGIITCLSGFSQRETTSPYSRYNYGDLFSNSLTGDMALGGSGIAHQHPRFISFKNPATHISVPEERFVFEVGAGTNTRLLEQSGNSSQTNSIGVEYFAFSFPILTDTWASSVGLLPFSTVGYEIFAGNDETSFTYSGTGGINQAVWGNAFQLVDDVTVGFHARYLFGKTYHQSIISFPYPAFSTEKKQTLQTKGLIWDFGLQYSYDISETSILQFGATYRDKQTLQYKQQDFFASFVSLDQQPKTYQDTITNNEIADVRTDIAQKIGIGFGYSIKNTLQYNLDIEIEKWDNVYVYGQHNPDIDMTYSLQTGVEYTPDYSGQSYFKKLPYRLGFHYSQLPIYEKNNTSTIQPIDFGISFGTDFILKQTGNSLSTAFIVGKRGDFTVTDAIQETYVMAKITVRLYEHWFFKQKID
ncbi:MAG: hypothetical protein PF481_08555 [Bacteroidales bacterium]|jgi:hypothetical protein|nr:hypothetical protein [Bacteroidales bacterium]